MLGQYRNQYLIERGYGNYLGLAQLQCYVARSVGLDPGELMILASHAILDRPTGVTIAGIRAEIGQLRSQGLLRADT